MKSMALICGSGFERILSRGTRKNVLTPFGRFESLETTLQDVRLVIIPRHGFGHETPPHRVKSKAHVFAIRDMGITKILATSAVGSVNKLMKVGDVVIVDQFIDLTKTRDGTFYSEAVHTDFTHPFCGSMRASFEVETKPGNLKFHLQGTYVCTEGPRYETPAEVRMIRKIGGDVVGQSAIPEAVLARELGLCYLLMTVVSNWGAGLQHRVSSRDILRLIWNKTTELREFLLAIIPSVAMDVRLPVCNCNRNKDDARALLSALRDGIERGKLLPK